MPGYVVALQVPNFIVPFPGTQDPVLTGTCMASGSRITTYALRGKRCSRTRQPFISKSAFMSGSYAHTLRILSTSGMSAGSKITGRPSCRAATWSRLSLATIGPPAPLLG